MFAGRPTRYLSCVVLLLFVIAQRVALADSVIVLDHFGGTASLASHQPDTNLPSHAWTVTGSGASVWNNQAWAGGADWAGILATIDSGVSDGTIAVDWIPSGDMPCGELVARATDSANYIVAYYWSGALYLSRVASTGSVLLASTAVDDPGTTTHRLKMVLSGSSIQLWYDGALRLSATDAFNIAATKHGFRWLSYYNWQSTYSNFEVDGNFVPTAATVTVTPTPTTVSLFHSITLTATAYDNAHNVIPNMSFSWTTSNPMAVTVASATGSTATVTGAAAGSATITAIPMQGSSSTATVTVNTGPVAVFDTFSGANATALPAHTPEVNSASGIWSTNGSGVFLNGNALPRAVETGIRSPRQSILDSLMARSRSTGHREAVRLRRRRSSLE